MTHIKQHFLAAGLLALSLGTSVALGYALNYQEAETKIDTECISIKVDTPKFHFNHSIKLLTPQLG